MIHLKWLCKNPDNYYMMRYAIKNMYPKKEAEFHLKRLEKFKPKMSSE